MGKKSLGRTRSRGFSLLEMVVAVTVIGLLAAVTIPMMTRVKQRNELNDLARRTLGDLRQARALGASGRIIYDNGTTAPAASPPPCPPGLTCAASIAAPSSPGNGDIRVRYGGIRIASTTSYTVFADDDNVSGNGGERDLTVVDFLAKNRGSNVRIIAPAPGTEIRFQANGTKSAGPTAITLEDATTGLRKTITITASGTAKL